MRNAFSKMFWGFLLVLIEIHFLIIDILPDPVGYYFIYQGISNFIDKYPVVTKGRNFAIGLMVFSIPSLFIQQNVQAVANASLLSGWSIYITILAIGKLILVYFVFQLMVAIVTEKGDSLLIGRTNNTFRIYMFVMLLINLIQPFTLNFSDNELVGYMVLSAIIGLIMEIVFLILLRRFMKLDDLGNNQVDSVTSMDNKVDDRI